MNNPYSLTGVVFAAVQNALKTRFRLWGVTLCGRGSVLEFYSPEKEHGGPARCDRAGVIRGFLFRFFAEGRGMVDWNNREWPI